MISLKKIDYIIPTWNSGATLEATIASIKKYGNPKEIIIVDRNSKDETLKIAEIHNCKIINSNSGLGAARIAGANAAQTELIGFVDSDVELTERWQDLMVYAQENKHEDAGVYGAYYEGGLRGNRNWPLILDGGNGAFGCIITRRSDILECIEMERFSSAEDGAYSRFLSRKGRKWYVFPITVLHHQDLTNISYYSRLRWMGAGLRVREGFRLRYVKSILGGAVFGIKMYNSKISYIENWRVRLNYFIGYVRFNKYYEIDRSKL